MCFEEKEQIWISSSQERLELKIIYGNYSFVDNMYKLLIYTMASSTFIDSTRSLD